MKKNLFFLLTLFSFSKFFSQEADAKKTTMGFYFNPSVNIGYNLKNNKNDVVNNTQYIVAKPLSKITYGVTAIGGYNFLPNFALGTGLKYSFVEDNYHLVYWVLQPRIIFAPGDQPFYIDLSYGKQLNHSVVSDADFWGARLGIQVSYSKRLSQEGGIVFERHQVGDSNGFFIGLNYGITIFSNKNYTGYGED